jgi:hypothetical protein
MVAALLAGHVELARSVTLPRVGGFEAIIAAIRDELGPDPGSILEDLHGVNATLLTCSVRLEDPDFRLRTLPFRWLLKYAGVSRIADLEAYGPTAALAIQRLLAHSGCEWIAVQSERTAAPASGRLRDALQSPRFRLVGTFEVWGPWPRVRGPRPSTVELYRQAGPIHGLPQLDRPGGVRTGRTEWLLRVPIDRSSNAPPSRRDRDHRAP